ncbi:carbohydrate sulfotransferase 12-like [Tachysurus fulvidraco]|uniref:carbohydrate sulfotransferase 12-like n=1 Tax=Tachysurus fulvidraco TaxID=1234273 RepID=UPI001FEE23FE|nr:carbohydrate sulfotransferase 12-like [Tachysurus fulvidraco]
MSKLKKLYLVLSILGFVSLMIFIYKLKENGTEEKTDAKTRTETETRAKLDTFEDRRCEGKIYTSPMPLKLKHRQYSRKIQLHKQCNANSNLDITGKWKSFDDIPNEELHNLLVDDRHGIIYCYVPKVGCTAWKRIMIVLSESLKVYGVPYRNPLDIPVEDVHGSSLQHLNAYPKAVMKQKLQTYKKFIFVRDPFVRLTSAYKDKLGSSNQIYYETIGIQILKQFGKVSNPPASVEQANAQGIVPSFSDFIQYILSLPARNYEMFDEHWKQTVHMCHPCIINYDFIGKMETIEEDAAHLLRLLKVDNIVDFKPYEKNKTSTDEMKTWFYNIPTEWRRKLYDIYRADFELFGYEYYDTLDDLYLENIM